MAEALVLAAPEAENGCRRLDSVTGNQGEPSSAQQDVGTIDKRNEAALSSHGHERRLQNGAELPPW
jgi:hypothetical protein